MDVAVSPAAGVVAGVAAGAATGVAVGLAAELAAVLGASIGVVLIAVLATARAAGEVPRGLPLAVVGLPLRRRVCSHAACCGFCARKCSILVAVASSSVSSISYGRCLITAA